MMLFKLSLKNIKKSFKDYAIYFFTLILGVAIFYVFNAINDQTVMLRVTSSTKEIIKLMTNMLSGVSVFVSFVLGFLIIYASRFLIKRRNKEFGIYLTLGMSKRKISLILFFETLFIGVISLLVGLGLGTILSQFMSLLVANMFEADMTKFQFVFSTEACIKTLVYFSIMYLLVMIFNTFIISKCKLIDLLHANKKSEKVKLKNPVICVLVFIISVLFLSYAYYCVTGGVTEKLDEAWKILIPITIGIVTTFTIFWSVSGLLLKIFVSLKKVYFKGLNTFTLRQVSSKINTTVFSMTIICLMLFVTICMLSSCLSLKNSMTENLNELAPADIELTKQMNIEEPTFDQGIKDDSNITIKDTMKNIGFDVDEIFKEQVDINIYQTGVTLKDSLGSSYEDIFTEFPFMKFDKEEQIVSVSDYNKIAKLYGNKTYSLEENQYIIIADYDSMTSIRNKALKLNTELNINNKSLRPKYKECKDGFIDMSANHLNAGIILVPNSLVNDIKPEANILIANYNVTGKEERQELDDKIGFEIDKVYNVTTLLSYNTKLDIAEAAVGLGGLVTFIGLYLGVIFLMSSAAILALKELSESTDNKERFMMLRRLGADEKTINRALFRQIAIFFMLPLLFALIHSFFGIKFAIYILETFGTKGLLPSIIMTFIFLLIIYGGYFLITYFCSKNIIKENR